MPYTLRNSNICALEEKESDMRYISKALKARGSTWTAEGRIVGLGFRALRFIFYEGLLRCRV